MFSGSGRARDLYRLAGMLRPSWTCRNKMSERVASNIISPQRRTYFDEKFNPEESAKILKILNEMSAEEDFKKYVISSKRTSELLKMRSEVGGFKDLDDLIPLMGVKVLDKFYNSMLEKKSLGLGNPMVPNIVDPSKYSRVLSISITGNRLSFCLIDRGEEAPLRIEALEVKNFIMTPKIHFITLLAKISELAKSLPPCDLCIYEEFASQIPSSYMFSYFLHITQVRSMLLGYLAAIPEAPQMMSIKSVAVAKLFNTYVGSEKVSGQIVVEDLFKNSASLEFNSSTRFQYLDADSETRECLSNVFLLNLAYWKLTSQCG